MKGGRNRVRGGHQRQRLSAWQKAERGMFLSMAELSIVTGFGENKVNEFKKRPGFPWFEGRTTLAKFQEWAFSQVSAVGETSPGSPKLARPPRPAEDRSCEPFR